jgi:hypothetical protein
MKSPSFKLVCRQCGEEQLCNSLYFKARKGSGLPYNCKCGADLYRTGEQPPKMGRSDSQKRSRLQEKKAAVRMGGKVQPGSGAGRAKSDVRVVGRMRMECKLTRANSYSLKLASLQKLERELSAGEDPAFEIEYQGVYPYLRYVVIPGWLFDHLLECKKQVSG